MMTTKDNLDTLEKLTLQIIEEAEEIFSPIEEDIFNYNVSPKKWSVAQNLNHLNHFAQFYHNQFYNILNNIEKKQLQSKRDQVKFSWLYKNLIKYIELDNALEPKKKSKASKGSFQVNSDFTKKEYDKFIENQKEILSILRLAKENKVFLERKIKTMIPLVKLKVLDMLSIHVHHNFRHFQQAKKLLKQIKTNMN